MTRDAVLDAAAEVLARTTADLARMDPEQIVQAAWTPTGPTIDQLRARLLTRRAA